MLAHTLARSGQWRPWLEQLHARDDERHAQIRAEARRPTAYVNPLHICHEIDEMLGDNTILVADGGDFVAAASYIFRPRRPLTWLDPGPFGKPGAKPARPDTDVWILFGDGSAGYSLAEFDTFVRHGVPVAAVVGNDASWREIARDQVALLGDAVGTVLARTDYHLAVEALGGRRFRLDDAELPREAVAQGMPALPNVTLGQSVFRDGSLSM